ncbi:MAG TPA: phosphotransferase, partial [Acidimicrobiales bacterium]|nr:phosphotransferase [Acidimicrobiales bacterium]
MTAVTGSQPESGEAGDDEQRTRGLIDEVRLAAWMDARDLPGAGLPLEATFITGGASNELFDIRRGEHRMALRRPPRIVPEGRNETMLREYRLLAALADTDVPHARAVAVCDDPEMMGGCFYLMEYVDGWSPMGGGGWPAPFDADPTARSALAFQLVDGIARLSRVD